MTTRGYSTRIGRPAMPGQKHVLTGWEASPELAARRERWLADIDQEKPIHKGFYYWLAMIQGKNPDSIFLGDSQPDGEQCWHASWTHPETLRREMATAMGLFPAYMYSIIPEHWNELRERLMKSHFWVRCKYGNPRCLCPGHLEVVYRGGNSLP